jgi:predicted transcriptional regulator of viral defense system
MKRVLGELETRFFAYAQMRRLQTVRLGELRTPLGISARQEAKILSQLCLAGVIARVRRGLYLVPPRLPVGGKWTPDEALALNTLMQDAGATYQITGPNAFNRYGFDEQVPTRLYVYNNRLSGDRTIGTIALTLIKVANDRLGSIEESKSADGLTLRYSSRSRTLVDAVYEWSRFSSLPRGYDWIRNELTKKRVKPQDLVRDTVRYGNQGTIRRIGALLERVGVSPRVLSPLTRAINGSSASIPWIPNRPKRGSICQRWGVVLNG